jgi:hypothetical protein
MSKAGKRLMAGAIALSLALGPAMAQPSADDPPMSPAERTAWRDLIVCVTSRALQGEEPSGETCGNVVLFCGLRNHVNLRGLPGGAEGIRTDGHRGRRDRTKSGISRACRLVCTRENPARSSGGASSSTTETNRHQARSARRPVPVPSDRFRQFPSYGIRELQKLRDRHERSR